MRKLYKRLVMFLLPVIAVWGGLEIFYRSVENNYTYKHQRVQEEYASAEVLILGSSHSYYGFNPDYFQQPTYNFSNISQSLYFDELLLERHINSLKQLKAVVLTIGYFSLSQQDNGIEDRWRKYFYQQQMDLDVPIVSGIDVRKYSLALSRKFNKSVELVGTYLHEGTILSCYRNGYGIQDSTDIVPYKATTSRLIAKKHEDGSMDFGHNVERLERIINLCKDKDVDVLLVEMPVFPDYFDAVNPVKRDSISSILASLGSSSDNTHHLKLSRDRRFRRDDLRDADHLTNGGAEKCSKIVSEFIRKL